MALFTEKFIQEIIGLVVSRQQALAAALGQSPFTDISRPQRSGGVARSRRGFDNPRRAVAAVYWI